MFFAFLFSLVFLYIASFIIKKECFDELNSNMKSKKYSQKEALESLQIFINTLNYNSKDYHQIYKVESIRKVYNKLYVKCFIQINMKYVRLYFASFRIHMNSRIVLEHYHEYGQNAKSLLTGASKSSHFAEPSFIHVNNSEYDKYGEIVKQNKHDHQRHNQHTQDVANEANKNTNETLLDKLVNYLYTFIIDILNNLSYFIINKPFIDMKKVKKTIS